MIKAAENKTDAPKVSFVGLMHEGVPCRLQYLDACIKFYTGVFGSSCYRGRKRWTIWRVRANRLEMGKRDP